MDRIFRKMRRAGTLMALIVGLTMPLAMVTAPQAEAAEYWKQKFVRFSATAGETLSVGDVVYIKASDGEAYKADGDDSTKRPAIGICGTASTNGNRVEIVVQGIMGGMTATSPGHRLFLSTEPGAVSPSVADLGTQVLGWVLGLGANSSTDYYIDVKPPQSSGPRANVD